MGLVNEAPKEEEDQNEVFQLSSNLSSLAFFSFYIEK
jgi:hypothetical protein